MIVPGRHKNLINRKYSKTLSNGTDEILRILSASLGTAIIYTPEILAF